MSHDAIPDVRGLRPAIMTILGTVRGGMTTSAVPGRTGGSRVRVFGSIDVAVRVGLPA
jgi:hypothetical protein